MLDLVKENLSRHITELEESLPTCHAKIKTLASLLEVAEGRVKHLESLVASYYQILCTGSLIPP
jgi:hypothetical protein